MPPSPARPQTAPNNVPWKRGDFLTFFAKMKIRVGGHSGNESIEIPGGDEFEYDGSVVRYAGREFPQPNMRAAIRDGWATMAGEDDGSAPAPFTSSRDVAKSQSKTTDLSRVQRNVRQRFESDSLDEETVLEVSDRKNVRDGRSGAGHLTSDHNRRAASHERGVQPSPEERMAVSASELDEQDGVEISSIRTPAKLKVDLTKRPNAARDIELSMDHEKGVGRFAGERRTRPNIIEREGVTIKTSVGSMDRGAAVDISDSVDGGRQVGTVRHSSKGRTVEGISVEDTSGDRTLRPSKAAPAKESTRVAPAKSAKPVVKPRIPDDAPQKLKMAIRRYPDFPVDWNFFAKPEDKLLRIKKLGANPDLLDAVYTAESPAMRKLLEQKFKSHFS